MIETSDAPSTAVPGPWVTLSRRLALGGTLGLIVLGLAWELWLAPTGSGWLAVKVLPLGLALPGLWRFRMYTYRWLSLLVWLYCLEGLVRGTSAGGAEQWLAWIEVLLCVALFTACALQVRVRLQAAKQRTNAAAPATATQDSDVRTSADHERAPS
ncbi:DUF2069 domain-containing protein [Ideonella livida]|uniref:DUF2069 domain-containing protein n=1 Tax=Ideonella livida TaxID=2707176 RepID=A0A7C9TIR6_9BURK|nr:DUF2069 domain-containing protein [Ideonella livida]NDY91440.1 DUF2069 domain-containing protein [Ideonella livida]